MCLFADRSKKKSPYAYWVIALSVFVVLCFGYMTGSDWRNYESLWDGSEDVDSLANMKNEVSFKAIMAFFHLIISDFWIFSAVMKILYVHSLLLFFKQYTNKPWLSFALTLQFTTLFMVIDCPMRFTMGIAFCLYGIVAYLNNKKILAIALAFVASTCHMTLAIVALIWLTRPLAKFFVKLNPVVMLLLYIVAMVLTNMTSAYQNILSIVFSVGDFAKYGNSYGQEVTAGELNNLGVITRLLFLLFPVFLKGKLIQSLGKKGEEIVYFACLCAYLGLFLGGIPTAFRLNTVNVFYSVLPVSYMLCLPLGNDFYRSRILLFSKAVVVLLFCVFIWRNTDSPKYQPYSNSIPYIINGHLPYSYRDTYNIRNYH